MGSCLPSDQSWSPHLTVSPHCLWGSIWSHKIDFSPSNSWIQFNRALPCVMFLSCARRYAGRCSPNCSKQLRIRQPIKSHRRLRRVAINTSISTRLRYSDPMATVLHWRVGPWGTKGPRENTLCSFCIVVQSFIELYTFIQGFLHVVQVLAAHGNCGYPRAIAIPCPVVPYDVA